MVNKNRLVYQRACKTIRFIFLATLFTLLLPIHIGMAQKVLWEKTGDTELEFSVRNSALFAHPAGTLFVGTTDFLWCADYCGSSGQVYRSRDDGRTWERTDFDHDGVTSFAAYPNGDLLLSTFEGLFRSSDEGQTWSEIPTTEIIGWIHAVSITEDEVIYVGLGGVPGAISGGIFQSTDNGETWVDQEVDTDWPYPIPFEFYQILQTPDGSLLAAGSEGVVAWREQGSWVPTLDSVRVLHLAGSPTGTIYASTLESGLYRSVDSGQNWELIAFPAIHISDIAVNTQGDVFVSSSNGLYGSSTNGDSWERLGEGIGALAITQENHLVSASFGSGDGSLFRSTTIVSLLNEEIPSAIPSRFSLDQNYPNPFSSATAISFTLRRSGPITIEVFDVMGRAVMVLTDGFLSAGRHTVGIEAGNLSSGIYLYRLRAGAFSETHRMILLR